MAPGLLQQFGRLFSILFLFLARVDPGLGNRNGEGSLPLAEDGSILVFNDNRGDTAPGPAAVDGDLFPHGKAREMAVLVECPVIVNGAHFRSRGDLRQKAHVLVHGDGLFHFYQALPFLPDPRFRPHGAQDGDLDVVAFRLDAFPDGSDHVAVVGHPGLGLEGQRLVVLEFEADFGGRVVVFHPVGRGRACPDPADRVVGDPGGA